MHIVKLYYLPNELWWSSAVVVKQNRKKGFLHTVLYKYREEWSIKLKLPTICKGCEIKMFQSTTASGQMLKICPASPDIDSLSPATAKIFKLQRQIDAFL